MAFLLEELIVAEAAARFPQVWRGCRAKNEKDLVCITDDSLSVEIKTSSHSSQIFGNRSYAQPSAKGKKVKSKSGFYLTVNFGRFGKEDLEDDDVDRTPPALRKIAFGWLDHTDWIAQTAATGQQARLGPNVYEQKLIQFFPVQATAIETGGKRAV
jgi:hypothetical protein